MRGNKKIFLNDRGDEQSAYLLALEDFFLLTVLDYNTVPPGKAILILQPVPMNRILSISDIYIYILYIYRYVMKFVCSRLLRQTSGLSWKNKSAHHQAWECNDESMPQTPDLRVKRPPFNLEAPIWLLYGPNAWKITKKIGEWPSSTLASAAASSLVLHSQIAAWLQRYLIRSMRSQCRLYNGHQWAMHAAILAPTTSLHEELGNTSTHLNSLQTKCDRTS